MMKMAVEMENLEKAGSCLGENGLQAVKQRLGSTRLVREWKTIAAMMKIYCRDHHGVASGLCTECQGLLDYAELRLERCRFGSEKPTCVKCPVHCYQPQRREQIREVMRYSGPKMLIPHPILSIRHVLDGYRKVPQIIR